jgi:hypothetical protein
VPQRLLRWQIFELDAGVRDYGAFEESALVLAVQRQLVCCCEHCVVGDVAA